MGWIAIVLAVYLFYKEVKRPHKIVALQALGLLLVLSSISITYWLGGFDKFKTENRKRDDLSAYVSNVYVDLKRVQEDPRLAEEFRRIYPSEFHPLLEFVLTKENVLKSRPSRRPSDAVHLPGIHLAKAGAITDSADS